MGTVRGENAIMVIRASFVALTFGFCLLSANQLSAATLDDYQRRIGVVQGHVNTLLDSVARSENGPRDVVREKTVIEQIKKELPESEKIDWPGGSVETSNQWLSDDLGSFQKEQDPGKRAVILTGVNERLAAISNKINELKNPSSAERSKDEDKQKLAEILRREEYQKPQEKEESLFQRLQRRILEWLNKVFPDPAPTPDLGWDMASLKFVLQIIIFVAVLGLVVFLAYRFMPFLMGKFGRGAKEKRTDRVILGERIDAEHSGSDLFDEAERLARTGDLRAAIRKGYIALLCELSDRKIIGLARHKTNRDYLRESRRRADLFENVNGLTVEFERNWYGLRPAEMRDWEDFRDRYKQTMAVV